MLENELRTLYSQYIKDYGREDARILLECDLLDTLDEIEEEEMGYDDPFTWYIILAALLWK